MRPVVWTAEPIARALGDKLPGTHRIGSARELFDLPADDASVVFLDEVTLRELDGVPPAPVVAVCEGPLQPVLASLPSRPWLSHVTSAALLAHPRGHDHLASLLATLHEEHARPLDWLKDTMAGKRVRLTRASACSDRLVRMSDYLASHGVPDPVVQRLQTAAAALLAAAFYEAPYAASAVTGPLSRGVDVVLPDDNGCDLLYGCTAELAAVRVRDPFGGATRASAADPASAWGKLAAEASFAATSVVANHHSDYWIAIARQEDEPRPLAVHVFWKNSPKRRFWQLHRDESLSPIAATFITCVTNTEEA